MNEIKICSYCGKEIIAEGRSKLCSAECQSNFYDEKIYNSFDSAKNKTAHGLFIIANFLY